jgi:small subunit ribosomal protein S4
MKGDTAENLIGLLESRLDAVVYRAKFVPTIFAARQFVNHGHVMVNGKRVNIRFLPLQAGRRHRGARKVQADGLVLEATQSGRARCAGIHRSRPQQDDRHLRARAGLADVPYPVVMEPNLVVEFYSR